MQSITSLLNQREYLVKQFSTHTPEQQKKEINSQIEKIDILIRELNGLKK